MMSYLAHINAHMMKRYIVGTLSLAGILKCPLKTGFTAVHIRALGVCMWLTYNPVYLIQIILLHGCIWLIFDVDSYIMMIC